MGETRVIPAKAGIQVFEIVIVSYSLDARLRGHDELRNSLLSKGGGGDFWYKPAAKISPSPL